MDCSSGDGRALGTPPLHSEAGKLLGRFGDLGGRQRVPFDQGVEHDGPVRRANRHPECDHQLVSIRI